MLATLGARTTSSFPPNSVGLDVATTPSSPFDKRRFFFDTGDSYGTGALEGRAESLLGRFRRESGRPERCVIGTKLAVYPQPADWRVL